MQSKNEIVLLGALALAFMCILSQLFIDLSKIACKYLLKPKISISVLYTWKEWFYYTTLYIHI